MRTVLTALCLALGVTVAAGQSGGVPVMIGTDGPNYDACGSVGQVVGLNPRGDNFLAVRTGPSTNYTKVDELYTADTVYVCESRGRWYGVVYTAGGRAGGCGVGSPAPVQRYRGRCRSGWVFGRYISIIAG